MKRLFFYQDFSTKINPPTGDFELACDNVSLTEQIILNLSDVNLWTDIDRIKNMKKVIVGNEVGFKLSVYSAINGEEKNIFIYEPSFFTNCLLLEAISEEELMSHINDNFIEGVDNTDKFFDFEIHNFCYPASIGKNSIRGDFNDAIIPVESLQNKNCEIYDDEELLTHE